MADRDSLNGFIRSLEPERWQGVLENLCGLSHRFRPEQVEPGVVVLLNLWPDMPERSSSLERPRQRYSGSHTKSHLSAAVRIGRSHRCRIRGTPYATRDNITLSHGRAGSSGRTSEKLRSQTRLGVGREQARDSFTDPDTGHVRRQASPRSVSPRVSWSSRSTMADHRRSHSISTTLPS